jgi:protoheme IX farnesyltransferase
MSVIHTSTISIEAGVGASPTSYADVLGKTLEHSQVGYAPSAGDFFALLKPRVMSLVVFTAFVGLMVAPASIDPVLGFTAILCIAIGAGASGALNMWYEADIDAGMERTKNRPIPDGRIEPGQALGFGLTLSIASVAMMGLAINWLAAGILAFTIFFYAVVYTMWLKRHTAQNIVIGGASGAFPPVIGYAAVTGTMPMEAWILFAIIFMWTPPHFWSLALFTKTDYAKVGVPMLPVVAGEQSTRRQIFLYSLLLVPLSIAPWYLGYAGMAYLVVTATMGAGFLVLASRVLVGEGEKAARKLFKFSILYLFVIFATLALETLILGGDV